MRFLGKTSAKTGCAALLFGGLALLASCGGPVKGNYFVPMDNSGNCVTTKVTDDGKLEQFSGNRGQAEFDEAAKTCPPPSQAEEFEKCMYAKKWISYRKCGPLVM